MLPEVQAYFDAVHGNDREADRAYGRMIEETPVPSWNPKASDDVRAAYHEAHEKRVLASQALDRAQKERHAAAYAALVNSDNPIVRWLMTDPEVTRDYSSYADTVLRSLPLTREEIDDFGERQSWCGDYGRLLAKARVAGVLPEPTPDLAEIAPLVAEIRRSYGGSTRTVTAMVKRHLPSILESAQVKSAEREAAANTAATPKTGDSQPVLTA